MNNHEKFALLKFAYGSSKESELLGSGRPSIGRRNHNSAICTWLLTSSYAAIFPRFDYVFVDKFSLG